MELKKLPLLAPWEERKPFLKDGFFHVPRYYDEHESSILPPFESESVFGNTNPIALEYCSGNGEWIVKKAIENPHINWIGVERQLKRAKQIFSKKQNHLIKNLLIVHGNAEEFTTHYLKDESISSMYINFPDPWPKAKHASNRLIQGAFISDMWRVIQKGSYLMVVTDDIPYSEQVLVEVLSNKGWESHFQDPCYANEYEGYGLSFFYRLWKEKGKEIRYMKFMRKENA